jgi:hypothetical protein
MQFDDPQGLLQGFELLSDGTVDQIGKMAVEWEEMLIKNQAYLNGVEVMRMYRAPRLHHGGYFELLYGVRWLQLSDTQYVIATVDERVIPTAPNPLTNSEWSTRAVNNVVGPQIGARMFKQTGRWVTSLEARFLAGANFQQVRQQTNLGTEIQVIEAQLDSTVGAVLPLNFTGLGTQTQSFATTFSPVGELRANASFQATSNVGLKVGYTGIVMGNATRASNRVDYSGNDLISIKEGGNHQLFFSNGLNFGVEINR